MKDDYFLGLFEKYRNKGILVDTNLLLLFVVGSFNPLLISRLSRTSPYSFDDFQIISRVIDYFNIRITTPHILTEVSNLIGKREELRHALGKFVGESDENFLAATVIVESDAFLSFGITDAAIYDLAKDAYLVLTDDGPLFGFLAGKGFDVFSLDILRKLTL